MNLPKRLWYYVFGPNICRCHRSSEAINQGSGINYKPNSCEAMAEKAFTFYKVSRVIITYTMPLWGTFIYRKGYYTVEHLFGFAKLAGWISILYVCLLLVRGIGRAQNPDYALFLNSFGRYINGPKDSANKKKVKEFDFDFDHWPVDFHWNEMNKNKTKRRVPSTWNRLSSQYPSSFSAFIFGYPKDFLAYLVSHSFGISMMYPGSTAVFKAACNPMTNLGRSKLVEENNGLRAKLQAEDGNNIDTMFVDRRSKDHPQRLDDERDPDMTSAYGDILVICCEGNAGFYEGGCMVTPLERGYSVLGWNHPGFMWSSGKPYPEADKNAIDVVMQYAIHKLGFQPQNIIIFAWSIGAFTGINAAVSYPDIKGLFLDATFNDVLFFAKKIMPAFAEDFVSFTIRNHLNLNHAENLRNYKGPISFVRRCDDEVMNIDGPHNVQSNLGNLLLEDFLRARFPDLFESDTECIQVSALRDWLHAEDDNERVNVMKKWNVSPVQCKSVVINSLTDGKAQFPMEVDKRLSSEEKARLVLFLANKYMQHLSSTHCTPLPGHMFADPWDPAMIVKQDENDDFNFEVIASD